MNTHILLGISGSIAAYKTPDLVRQLIAKTFQVRCIMTENATSFVTKIALETVSESPVYESMTNEADSLMHLSLARNASLFIIAPATAQCIAKLAHGFADDLLSLTFLSYTGPKMIVPAMHSEMYLNPIVQKNIATLKENNIYVVGPDHGELSCGDVGIGRMVDVSLIVDAAVTLQKDPLKLDKKRILITAGGTKEPIDSVRVLTNLSTGKLGHQLANTAALYGAEVGVITTIPTFHNPMLKDIHYVTSAKEMQKTLHDTIHDFDVLYMVAAVSDYTFEKATKKIKRTDSLTLKATSVPDLLQSLAPLKNKKRFIGFALEDHEVDRHARRKLKEKGLDYIVANSPGSMGQSVRDMTIYSKHNTTPIHLKEMSLDTIAVELLKLSQ